MTERRLFKKMPAAARRRILVYIDSPTYEDWVAIRDTPVVHGQTLWDMVDKINRSYEGWFPPAIYIARASKLAEKRAADLAVFDEDNLVQYLMSDVEAELAAELDSIVPRPPEAS